MPSTSESPVDAQAAAVAAAEPGAPAVAGGGAEGAGGAGSDGPGTDGPQGGFRVRLDNFEGPFDLLLSLIAKHRMDVTEVALATVTDEFLAHIRAMGPDWDLDAATEFLVVAATLLDLKAARLLPAAEVEDEEDLALLEARDLLFARLLQYRAYKRAAALFGERWAAELLRRPRSVGLEPRHAALLPEVVIAIGTERFAQLAARAMTPKPPPVVYVDHIHSPPVSVREQAGLVVDLLAELGEATFRRLVEDAPDTMVVVARFLALLELYRERVLAFEQPDALGELLVRWVAEADRGVIEVTDEFDRPPDGAEQSSRAPGSAAGSAAGSASGMAAGSASGSAAGSAAVKGEEDGR
ncbi:condensin subunit ScpA [Streptomyces sp. TLI_053]|uniref:segregation and condensation protein A n=1 Tax=Streptomyces sp. TLI_053 TaxID=1855352 RepID=UPI00087A0D99|nr:segregation/condensation protein A [Streptomyces sp. TLI_053]SDT44980.1 condensin subunit ScpA [Streptomyces sp. TLI_053]